MNETEKRKLSGFISLAFTDYLAARALLRLGLLVQALPLAATAIEKQLKAALLALGKPVSKSQHLCPSLTTQFKKAHPGLMSRPDDEFLDFLARGFKLRYAQAESEGFAIVINQARTLIALDHIFLRLDEPFRLIDDNGAGHLTPYRNEAERKNEMLVADNVALTPRLHAALLLRQNKVVEIGLGGKFADMQIEYETEGANIHGSFLKKPNFKKGMTTFQVTFG